MVTTRYNEKAWAIDIISEINIYLRNIDINIKRAGGERTLYGISKRLFPDVLLFGDEVSGSILQGWELKFPDTPITDNELFQNARDKADLLGLNSFLIWNVTTAVLFIRDEKGNYNAKKSWSELSHINLRDLVEQSKNEWISLLKKILLELNQYFLEGKITTKTIVESFSKEGVIDLILRNSDRLSKYLILKSREDTEFDAKVNIWWRSLKKEYSGKDNKWIILSKVILITWINKFIFSHIIKTYYSSALEVNELSEKSSMDDATNTFKLISKECNFLNILKNQLGENYVDDQTWFEIMQFNQFLVEFKLEKIDQDLLHNLLQKTVHITKRKTAGQFTTPYILAQLLVRLTMDNKNRIVYDPFCGTGTIIKASYDIKAEYGINSGESLSSIWASDKFSYPVQITTLSLAHPENISRIIQVFQKDITKVKINEEIHFCNPNTGNDVKKVLPQLDYIVSNLPFVQQEDVEVTNPDIKVINDKIKEITQMDKIIPPRSDLYVYLPFYLWFLLKDDGKVGVITPNAWLGTDYGKDFRNLLREFYDIEDIVISGKGRWFQETDIVTILLILKKKIKNNKNNKRTNNREITFITLNKTLEEIKNDTKEVSTDIITKNSESNSVNIKKYNEGEIKTFEELGLEWSAFFVELNWILKLKSKLIKANLIFNIKRGERRGWDDLFYPQKGHGIEGVYLKPVLKSPKSIIGLVAEPDALAFCCSKSIKELKKLGHTGALSWIKRFENQVNQVGRSLKEELSRSGMYWYEMSNRTIAELVANINYDERLFISKLKKPSFVNQRLTRFTLIDKSNNNIDLYHALLNSILGLFYLEALGFGRGLGALDLNTTKLHNQLFIFNPLLLDKNKTTTIKEKFLKLKNRKIYPIAEEVYKEDRVDFDEFILNSFGFSGLRDKIVKSLLELYYIRKSVNCIPTEFRVLK